MLLILSPTDRAALADAATCEPRVRVWKRYRAILLVADAMAPDAVATALDCSRSSVYGWVAAYRANGIAGLAEGPHRGADRRLDSAGDALVVDLLGTDPQARGHRATGWTVPLVQTELARAGYRLSARTVRRALHRLGYRWKRPRYVLGRPDPGYDAKRGAWPTGPG